VEICRVDGHGIDPELCCANYEVPTRLVVTLFVAEAQWEGYIIASDLIFKHLFFCSEKCQSALPNRAKADSLACNI
jgi:hypothetical protein